MDLCEDGGYVKVEACLEESKLVDLCGNRNVNGNRTESVVLVCFFML